MEPIGIQDRRCTTVLLDIIGGVSLAAHEYLMQHNRLMSWNPNEIEVCLARLVRWRWVNVMAEEPRIYTASIEGQTALAMAKAPYGE